MHKIMKPFIALMASYFLSSAVFWCFVLVKYLNSSSNQGSPFRNVVLVGAITLIPLTFSLALLGLLRDARGATAFGKWTYRSGCILSLVLYMAISLKLLVSGGRVAIPTTIKVFGLPQLIGLIGLVTERKRFTFD